MRIRLALAALAALVVFLVAAAIASFVVDPENIGVRLVLYVIALLAAIGAIVLAVFAIILRLFGRTGVAASDVEAARAAGREAFARVESAAPTGGQLNGAWAYDARLVVAARDVAAYEIVDRVRVHRRDGKLAGRGEIITVVRLDRDAPHVVVTAGPAGTPQDAAVPVDAPPWPSGG